jgi:hypothetical protein
MTPPSSIRSGKWADFLSGAGGDVQGMLVERTGALGRKGGRRLDWDALTLPLGAEGRWLSYISYVCDTAASLRPSWVKCGLVGLVGAVTGSGRLVARSYASRLSSDWKSVSAEWMS